MGLRSPRRNAASLAFVGGNVQELGGLSPALVLTNRRSVNGAVQSSCIRGILTNDSVVINVRMHGALMGI